MFISCKHAITAGAFIFGVFFAHAMQPEAELSTTPGMIILDASKIKLPAGYKVVANVCITTETACCKQIIKHVPLWNAAGQTYIDLEEIVQELFEDEHLVPQSYCTLDLYVTSAENPCITDHMQAIAPHDGSIVIPLSQPESIVTLEQKAPFDAADTIEIIAQKIGHSIKKVTF
jgi:hypothetical protein